MSEAKIPSILFDQRDYRLIRIVNEICGHTSVPAFGHRKFYVYFHPHGIKEMVESRSLRVAYAMVHLLTSLEVGAMDDRINALKSLRAEVLDTAVGPMPRNTARVLLQIMKEIIRSSGDTRKQLELAHDFRMTLAGKPRIVRRQLAKYFLLEMPEEWNQISFDDHVHDANTKGRKSSTHLIMDAWIKGIRRLRIIHYNYIEAGFAAELLEAANLMKIDVRIGIEFSARFRNRYVQLIWVPRGFGDAQAFLCFLADAQVNELMQAGREVSAYQQTYVSRLLRSFNENHRERLSREYEIELPPLDEREFIRFVGIGQKSVVHLEKYIQQQMLCAIEAKALALRDALHPNNEEAEESSERSRSWFTRMKNLDLDLLIENALSRKNNPGLDDPDRPADTPDVPPLLQLSPFQLLSRLAVLPAGYRVTLNLTGLDAVDVLELLYDCEGMITRLELFNLKDWVNGQSDHIPAISKLQEAINGQVVIVLKRIILGMINNLEGDPRPEKQAQKSKLSDILHDIGSLQSMYRTRHLKARIGSDSTGRSIHSHGMGLAVLETLPYRARQQVKKELGRDRELLPIHIEANERHTYFHRRKTDQKHSVVAKIVNAIPFSSLRAGKWRVGYKVQEDAIRVEETGNVITLGGMKRENTCKLLEESPQPQSIRNNLAYLNSHFRNILKVLLGFIPAFATFYFTKKWWLLAYCGAFIWLGITGIRNILQSVIGGGGFRRSPMLRWNAYVSWDRIADSLLYTGFSVPLLEYIVKTVALKKGFGITVATHPIELYSLMALANGVYLTSHNLFRGLQKSAAFANFFRSILSIPIAVALNTIMGLLLGALGLSTAPILQKWAAIISKFASDIVAGIIEGAADRQTNIRQRFREFKKKLSDLLDIQAQLELLFPEDQAIQLITDHMSTHTTVQAEARDLEKIICIHALDALYFWDYQPRAHVAFHALMANISEEERHIWVTSQDVLLRQRFISQMFIDGLLGDDFARALSFYLSRSPLYLEQMKRFV